MSWKVLLGVLAAVGAALVALFRPGGRRKKVEEGLAESVKAEGQRRARAEAERDKEKIGRETDAEVADIRSYTLDDLFGRAKRRTREK